MPVTTDFTTTLTAEQDAATKALTVAINTPREGYTPPPVPITVNRVDTTLSMGGEALMTKLGQETIQVTLGSDMNAMKPAEAAEFVFKAFAGVKPLADNVSFESEGQHAVNLRKKLQGFKDRGAPVPDAALKWGGLDAVKVEQWNAIPDHGASGIGVFPKGVQLFIPIAENIKDQSATTAPYEEVQKYYEDNKAELRQKLARRLGIINGSVKKKKGPLEAGDVIDAKKWADTQATANSLEITVQKTENGPQFSNDRQKILEILISSPKQVEFMKTVAAAPNAPVADAVTKEMVDSNPLSHLSDVQRGKVIGRVFVEDTPPEVFAKVAGREDAKTLAAKNLIPWAGTDAAKLAEVTAFINDDSFKAHQVWDKSSAEIKERGPLKDQPVVTKNAAGELVVKMDVPAGKASEIISQIATGSQVVSAAATTQPAAATEPAAPILKIFTPEATQPVAQAAETPAAATADPTQNTVTIAAAGAAATPEVNVAGAIAGSITKRDASYTVQTTKDKAAAAAVAATGTIVSRAG